MIKEPGYTLTTYKYKADRKLATKEGYQWFDIDCTNNQLVPQQGGKLLVKANLIDQHIRERSKARTVLDIGCDKGYFSWVAVSGGASAVTAVDKSAKPIEFLKEMSRMMRWPIEPLQVDLFESDVQFIRPFGYALALAVIHQVERKSVQDVLARIRSLVKHGALIEFCEDYREEKGPDWNADNFVRWASQHFAEVELLAKYEAMSAYKGHRYIYDCRCH